MTAAFSYHRFSHPSQAKGDSMRRQTEGTVALCRRKGWTLDDTLTYRDLGVSAFRGKNRHKGALGTFLRAVHEGKVRKGSVLIIESLDRLSRQNIDDAYELLREILKAGITVATISPEREYTAASLRELVGIIEPLVIMARANEESEMKSKRLRDKWEALRAKRKVYGTVPGWIRIRENRSLEVIEAHAATVRQIFAWVLEGRGLTWITKRLNDTGVPIPGDGAHNKSGMWHKSYVTRIVKNRAVIGERRPCRFDAETRARVETGEVWPGFYPRVISDADFYRVQGLLAQRCNFPGRTGKATTNLFSGLIVDARDSRKMRVVDKRGRPSHGHKMLVSAGAREGARGSVYIGFPLDVFEKAFLRFVTELKPEDVVQREPDDVEDEIATLEGQLADTDRRINRIKAELETHPDLDLLLDTLTKLSSSRKATAERLDRAKAKRVNGERENLENVQSLADILDNAAEKEREPLRLRLQSAIRQVVSEIWMLVVLQGAHRRSPKVAACQIWFKGGAAPRTLLVRHPAGKRGPWSLPPHHPSSSRIGLRHRKYVELLEQALGALDLDKLAAMDRDEIIRIIAGYFGRAEKNL